MNGRIALVVRASVPSVRHAARTMELRASGV
jgi:hypothetical protein